MKQCSEGDNAKSVGSEFEARRAMGDTGAIRNNAAKEIM
jgi:hypothetical protein